MTTTIPNTRDNTGRKKSMSMRKLFDKVEYKPHDGQVHVHAARRMARFRLASCGRRYGKSNLGGHELTAAAMKAYYAKETLNPKGKRHEYWIVGPEYSDAEKEFRVMYNDMVGLGMDFDQPGTYYSADGTNMSVSLFGGRFLVHAKSAKYPQNLVGEALMGAVFAEASKLKPTVWTKYIRPTLADYAREGSWALFASTPEGKNWFYDLYMRGQNPADPQWWSTRQPSWTNNYLFPGGAMDPEILDMKGDMTEEKFKQEIEADFTEFTGRVFKRFSEEDNVGDYPYDPRWPVYLATDYGFTNPNVMLFVQVDIWGKVWVCAEYYQRNRTSQEFAADIASDPKLGALARKASLLYPDPEDPGASATLANALGVLPQSGTGGVLADRIDLIRRWLVPGPDHLEDGDPDKKPRLFFDRSCKETIREMNDYRYPETVSETSNAKENPMKKDDHAPEALGRFFGGHFKQDVQEQEHAIISHAQYQRGR